MNEAPCRCLRSRALLIRWTSHLNRRSYVALAKASTAKSAWGKPVHTVRCRPSQSKGKKKQQKKEQKKTLNPHLFLGLSLLDVLSAHFDPGGQDGPGELQHVDAQQVAQLLSSRVVGHGGLVVVLLLHEGDVAELEHGGDDLQHGCKGVEGR